jgi:hypothetical protein
MGIPELLGQAATVTPSIKQLLLLGLLVGLLCLLIAGLIANLRVRGRS